MHPTMPKCAHVGIETFLCHTVLGNNRHVHVLRHFNPWFQGTNGINKSALSIVYTKLCKNILRTFKIDFLKDKRKSRISQ